MAKVKVGEVFGRKSRYYSSDVHEVIRITKVKSDGKLKYDLICIEGLGENIFPVIFEGEKAKLTREDIDKYFIKLDDDYYEEVLDLYNKGIKLEETIDKLLKYENK